MISPRSRRRSVAETGGEPYSIAVTAALARIPPLTVRAVADTAAASFSSGVGPVPPSVRSGVSFAYLSRHSSSRSARAKNGSPWNLAVSTA